MSEQADLFNSNESLSLLSELTLPRPQKSQKRRKTKWLKDPEDISEGEDWAFIIPNCFNDALDIKKTLRIKNKKNKEKHKIWTQGSTFFFKTGDIFYNKKEAYTDWPKAISEELCAIQVVSGKSSTPGKNGQNEKNRDKGEVSFTVFRNHKNENILKKEETRFVTQDDFIKILILGLESVSL
jgi:hypothetical protein